MNHPNQIKWNDGDLPPVESVPYDCRVLVWFVTKIPMDDYERCRESNHPLPHPDQANGKLCRIEMCALWKNDLNPLRWCDSGTHPVGYHEEVKHWAWLSEGTVDEENWKEAGF